MHVMASTLAELIRGLFNLSQFASEIIASVIIFALAIIVAWIGYSVFQRYIANWAKKTKTKLDDEILKNIKAPIFLLAILVGAYYGLDSLTFLETYSALLASLFTVAEILVVTFILVRIINVLTSWYAQKAEERERRVSNHLLFILRKTIQVAIYIFAILAILVTFKIDLSGVVLGLGIGGIAIALALQSLLSDALSAFSIYFDRPFEIGDFVVIGEHSGTVKKIGLKSTRIQLLHGEELVISNRELTTASVRNFKRMKKRRVTFTVKVTCDTPLRKLKEIPEIIAAIVKKIELTELDMVHFKEFGNSSLDFQVVFYMKTDDYRKYMDTRQEINFAIIEAFEKEGIRMAFPTQTILLNKQLDSTNQDK